MAKSPRFDETFENSQLLVVSEVEIARAVIGTVSSTGSHRPVTVVRIAARTTGNRAHQWATW
jgi:hypothetical protein